MMASCEEIEPLLAACSDDEASGDDRARVREHVAGCARCRKRATSDASGRTILRGSAQSLRLEAPPGLRERCVPRPSPLDGARGASSDVEHWQSRRAWLSLSWTSPRAWAIAAAVLLMVAGAIFTAAGSTRVLAAELALDHLKCFALFERASAQPDPVALARTLEENYGWRLKVPSTEPQLKLQLVGGRRCFSTDGRVAHILYRHDGRALSLFVVPGIALSAAALAVVGHRAIMWSHDGMTYAVVGQEDSAQLARVAAYMQAAME